jgi:uncharacterized protein YdaU (DUF1376 family)
MADTPLGWYPWYPRDFNTSIAVRSMSLTARGIYRELLDIQWESERLPNAKRLLSVLQATDKQWEEFAPFLDELFPNGQNIRLKEMRDLAIAKSRKARESGSKGGLQKRTPSKRLPNAKRTPSQTETETQTKKVDKSTLSNNIPEQFKTTKGQESWREFVAFRKEINKPLTDTATKLITNKLQGFSEEEMIVALETAIEKRWVTVYPKSLPKTETSNTDATSPYGEGFGTDWGFDPDTKQKEAYTARGRELIAGVAA